jgi:hypothetical protein
LIVGGFNPRNNEWFSLVELRRLAQARSHRDELTSMHLRVFGPEDYEQRLRDYLAERGGFSQIPGGNTLSTRVPASEDNTGNLNTRILILGVTQTELASYLQVSKSFVSQLSRGARRWPERLRLLAEAYLDARASVGQGPTTTFEHC